MNSATCTSVDGSFSCTCPESITGDTCESFVAFYGEWTEGSCSQTCGSAIRTDTRICTDIDGTTRDVADCGGTDSDLEQEEVSLTT